MGDIRIDLPDLKWRGLDPVPALVKAWTFSHDQPQRRYPYVNGAGHDWTGRGPIQMTATLYFNSPMIPDPFGAWIKWREALLDGSPGDLVHPTVGEIRAVVIGGTADEEPNARNNFQVTVNWEEHTDDPEAENDLNNQDLTILQAAEEAEAAAAAFDIVWPDGSYEDSLTDCVSQLEGAAFELESGISSYADKVSGTLDGMVSAASLLTDPLSHPAFDGLVGVWDKLTRIKDKAAKTIRSTSSRIVSSDTTIDAFAKSVKNTTEEIQNLNPTALRFPVVKKGTTLTYYT